MANIANMLTRWQSNGLITEQQVFDIQEYEKSREIRSWAKVGALVLGAMIIGLGLISVIAANWTIVSGNTKLILDFALMLGMSILTIKSYQQNRIIRFEISLLFSILLSLASIGLIAQMYQINIELFESILLCSAMTFPIIFITREKLEHMVVPFVWLCLFVPGLVISGYFYIYQHTHGAFDDMLPSLVISSMLIFACIALTADTLSLQRSFRRAAGCAFFTTAIITLVMGEIYSAFDSNPFNVPGTDKFVLILSLMTSLCLILNRAFNKSQKLVLLSALVLCLIGYNTPGWFLLVSYRPINTILILGALAIFTASNQQQRVYNFLMLLIGIRFFALYCQMLDSLLTTGFGLIFSGFIIIGIFYAGKFLRPKIANIAKKML